MADIKPTNEKDNPEENVYGSKNDNINEDTCKKIRSNGSSDEIDEMDDPPFSFTSPIFWEEIKMNIRMAVPLVSINLFQYLLMVETTAISGRFSATVLAGIVLAISLIESFGISLCAGFVSACDTLMSQAYGSENKKRTGLFLQRAFLLLNILPLIIWGFNVNFEPILIKLGQNPNTARVTGEFVINFIPGLMFMLDYLILARYMQNQNCFIPSITAALCGNIFNICSQLLFVTYLGFGYKAGAVCFSLSYLIMFLIELVYIIVSKFYIPTWPGFEWEAFYDWKQMTTLGLSGMVHTAFEVIVWEASVFMGGLLGTIQLATNSILMQIMSVAFFIYFGAGIASNIRVGQCLGANRPNQAKFAYRAAVTITLCIGSVMCILLISIHKYITYIFTNQKDVITMVANTIPIIYIIFLTDALSGICIGCLRGCGRQFSGALIMFISYYIIALPMSIILAFVYHFDVKGIWIGNACGSVFNVICNILILECQNWDKQAQLAQDRIAFSTFNQKRLSSSTKSESEFLLGPKYYDLILGDKASVYSYPSSITTPSNPITCSTEYVPIPSPTYGKFSDLQKIMLTRTFIYLSFIIFFIACILIHVFLPTELYRPQNKTLSVQ